MVVLVVVVLALAPTLAALEPGSGAAIVGAASACAGAASAALAMTVATVRFIKWIWIRLASHPINASDGREFRSMAPVWSTACSGRLPIG